MKKILPLFAILFCFTSASAQINYSNSYDIAESADNAVSIFKKDSLIFTVSLGLCGLINSFRSCTGILCTNLAGEEQWRIAIDSASLTSANAVMITDDYLYLALQSQGVTYQGPQIFKVDFFGNLIDSADILEEDDFKVYGLHKVENGFKLYVGKADEAPEIYGALVYLNEDYEQASLQRYTFEGMLEFIPVTMVELGDEGSNIIIVYVGMDELYRTMMIRLDTAGNVLWTYPMLGENTPTSNNIKISHIPDQGFYVNFEVGDMWDFENPPKAKFAKFSEDGNLAWSRELNFNLEERGIRTSFLTSNQEIVGVGGAFVDSLPGLHGYINRHDLEGNLLWERIIVETAFSTNFFNFVNGGIELDNNDLIFCGYLTDDSSGTPGLRTNTWLVRTTPDGCLDVDDCDNLTPTEEVALLEQKDFILYPNPADAYITVDAENFLNQDEWDIRIFNASGQLEVEVQVSAFPHQINTQNLAAGFYFLELKNKKGGRKMLKFVRG